MWVEASFCGEARGLWINASPWEYSLFSFQLSEFRICKEFSPGGNHGSCGLSAASDENLHYSFPATWQMTTHHPDGTWMKFPTGVVWWAARGITPIMGFQGQIQDLPHVKPVTHPLGHGIADSV